MSGGKFTPVKGLDQIVARMIVDDIQKVVVATEAEAKRQAPPTKKWISRGDAFVRRSHVAVHGEEIPENLRFELRAYQWDVEHPGALPVALNTGGGHDMHDSPLSGTHVYLKEPRDPSPGHYVQIYACRCVLSYDPEGVAKWVSSSPAKRSGTTVRGTVYAKGKYVIPAEYGDVYPGGFVSPGTWFMHRTVGIMKARL